jgi:hypothetical protein
MSRWAIRSGSVIGSGNRASGRVCVVEVLELVFYQRSSKRTESFVLCIDPATPSPKPSKAAVSRSPS